MQGFEKFIAKHGPLWTFIGILATIFGVFWTLSKHYGILHPTDPKA